LPTIANNRITIGYRPASRVQRPAVRAQGTAAEGRRLSRFLLWVLLVGMFMPPTVAVNIGTLKLSSGRAALILLIIPAMKRLFSEPRRFVWSDPLVAAAVVWIVGGRISVQGLNATSFAEGVEFLGYYMLARAFFLYPTSLNELLPVLRAVALVLLILAILDFASNEFVINEITGKIFGTVRLSMQRDYSHFHRTLFGHDVIRATSTFDHPILYGTFCCIAGSFFLFAERSRILQMFSVAACLLGVLLSGSSAPLLGFMVAIGIYAYDLLLRNYNWRWKVFQGLFCAWLALVFLVIAHPLQWMILHLTLDPVSGYYRIMEWDAATEVLHESPYVGFGAGHVFGIDILDVSIDSVWLVLALKYGVPSAVLCLLSSLVLLMKGQGRDAIRKAEPLLMKMRTAFSLINILFVIIGFTVAYWNSMWEFWGLCIGIRASLEEYLNKCKAAAPSSKGGAVRLVSA
jgi:hypothetical protein